MLVVIVFFWWHVWARVYGVPVFDQKQQRPRVAGWWTTQHNETNSHHPPPNQEITSQQLDQNPNVGRLVVIVILNTIAFVNVQTFQPLKYFVHQRLLQGFVILRSLCVCFVLVVVVVIVVLLCDQRMCTAGQLELILHKARSLLSKGKLTWEKSTWLRHDGPVPMNYPTITTRCCWIVWQYNKKGLQCKDLPWIDL